MAIKIKEKIYIDSEGEVQESQFKPFLNQVSQLLAGEYAFYVCDSKRNRTPNQFNYLFGVVLKMISADSGMEPNDLYRIFEKKYAPIKTVHFDGEDHIVQDLKRCNSKEFGLVIEKIIRFADTELGIIIPTREQMREAVAQDQYIDMYNDVWAGFIKK